jgi:hypothetical protein
MSRGESRCGGDTRLRRKRFGCCRSRRAGDICKRVQTNLLNVTAGLALIAGACGAPETDTHTTEARQQPLRAFGDWTQTPAGLSFRAPVIIPSNSAGTMMAAVGLDDDVYTSSTQDPGGIGVSWRKVSSFGQSVSGFPDWVAGAGLLGEQGAMTNAVVLAYNPWGSGQIFIRVQNQDGSVVFHDWDVIPSLRNPNQNVFLQGISMAWLPRYSLSGSQRKLIIVAKTAAFEGLVYIAANTLTNGVYDHAGWSTFAPMQLPGGSTLPGTFGPGGLSVAWACPWNSSEYSLVVAALERDSFSTPNMSMYFTKYNGSTGGWGPWTRAQNGAFLIGYTNGIGLAAGCSEFGHEMTLAGLGTDNRVWVDARQVSGGPPSWTPIGTKTFFPYSGPMQPNGGNYGQVSAGYSQGQAWVTSVDVLSFNYNKASAP